MSLEENVPGTVVVKILDKEYQVSCPPSEQEALLKSARYLDESRSVTGYLLPEGKS